MPLIARVPAGLTPDQVAALQDIQARAQKAQSVGATILSNMTQLLKDVDAILNPPA